jgi:DNA primase
MIKPEVIEDIINTARIEEVVGDFVRLTKRGVNHIGLCPFHNEKTPSFTVNAVKGIFKCFGCGVGGDAISFVMKHENYSYVEALRYLARKYNIEIKEEQQTPDQLKELSEREALYAVCAFAKDYFVKTLTQSEEGKSIGLSYFKERGFSLRTIEKFQLGYASEEKDAFTQHALKNGYSIGNLEKSGLSIVKENNYSSDRFRGRVIFPIHNFSGKVIGFGGRILSALKTANAAKYINSPETGIYHKSDVLYGLFFAKMAIKREDRCLLVEGYTDVISLYQTGIENVVASSGTSLTVGQIKLIRKLTDNITIVYDGDSAGIKAALRGISLVLQEGMNVRIVLLPNGEDPDSFARNNLKEDCLTYIEEHEESFIRFKANLLRKEIGNDPIKKAQLLNEIAADISLIKDLMMRSMFIQECSVLLDVSEETLTQVVNKTRVKHFYDERAKEKGLPIDQEEKQTFVETLSPDEKTMLPLPTQDREIDTIEQHILRLLINRGEDILYMRSDNYEQTKEIREMRLDQFVFDDLCNDEIVFENELYQKLFLAYADTVEQHPENAIAVLRRHEDESIRNLCIDLIDIPIQESPLWESERIKNYIRSIHNDKSKLMEDAIRSLQMLKLNKIRRLRNQKLEELKQELSEEDELILLHELRELNAWIKEMESVLGTTYREK